MRATHAGGIIRAAVVTGGADLRAEANSRPPVTPVREWTGERQCRTGRTWGANDSRARLRRIARRRAAKGYRFADGRKL
jgi:hypothetical protein